MFFQELKKKDEERLLLGNFSSDVNGTLSKEKYQFDEDSFLKDNSQSQSIIFERFHDFDDGSVGRTSESSTASVSSAVSLSRPSEHSLKMFEHQSTNHLMIVSLLEYICSLYTDDEESNGSLFKVLSERLCKLKLMPEVAYLDEFKAIRVKYQVALTDLMAGAVASIKRKGISLQPEKKWQLQERDTAASFTYRSWYKDMFSHEMKIGSGGFGHVVKARNKLDRKYYAIKKIILMESEPVTCLKTLREVQVFSNLNHQNVVRYHSSWLEYNIERDDDQENTSARMHSSNHQSTYDSESTHNDILFGKFGSFSPRKRYSQDVVAEIKVDESEKVHDEKQLVAKERPCLYRSKSNGNTPHRLQRINELGISDNRASAQLQPDAWNMVLHIQMELCHATLSDWLRDRNINVKHTKYVDCLTNLSIFNQLLEGVAYIHNKSLLHRDLKPANIFINQSDEKVLVKIGDFGLARHDLNPKTPEEKQTMFVYEQASSGISSGVRSAMNQTSGIGTATYAAPEQKYSTTYCNKVDVFSLGVILYELFRPFGTAMERFSCIGTLLQKRLVCETVTKHWNKMSALILDMTSKNPSDRPSAADVRKTKLFDSNAQVDDLRKELWEKEKEIERLKLCLVEKRFCEKCRCFLDA